jgi:hypothetical protein
VRKRSLPGRYDRLLNEIAYEFLPSRNADRCCGRGPGSARPLLIASSRIRASPPTSLRCETQPTAFCIAFTGGPQAGTEAVAEVSQVFQFSILHVPFGKALILLSQVRKSILVLVLIHAAELVIRFKHHRVTVLSIALAGLERAGDWRIAE